MPAVAKLFMSGDRQAVRLPKGFCFSGDEVCIKRIGSAILLFPKNEAWSLMGGMLGKTDDDFMAERKQPTRLKTRKLLNSRKTQRR